MSNFKVKTSQNVYHLRTSLIKLNKVFELRFTCVLGPLLQVSLQRRLNSVKHAVSRLAHTLVLLFPVISFYPSSSKQIEYMHTGIKVVRSQESFNRARTQCHTLQTSMQRTRSVFYQINIHSKSMANPEPFFGASTKKFTQAVLSISLSF